MTTPIDAPEDGPDPVVARMLRHPEELFDLRGIGEIEEALRLIAAERETRAPVPAIAPLPFPDPARFAADVIRAVT
jgi:hypothetical protein